MAEDKEARPATFDDLLNVVRALISALLPHAQTIILDDGTPIRTVDLEGLLKTKRTVRDKDKFDSFAIERALTEKRKRDSDE